jgi:hypothetical protein
MLIRAVCHVHSEWSFDGKWSLEKLAAFFSRRRYQVIMITEHDQGFDEFRLMKLREACLRASTANIFLMPGIEYSDPSNRIHLLVWGDIPFLGCGANPDRILAAVQERAGVAVFAHPSRKDAWKLFKPEWKDKLLGIEFWNRKTDGWAPSKNARPLLEMTQAVPFVGLDFHNARQLFPLTTALQIDRPVSEEIILAALRARRCSSEAFGLSLKCFVEGTGAKALHGAEFLRRRAALLYRKIAAWKPTRSAGPL